MTPKERVLRASRHQETDRVPKGELVVEEAFLDRLYPQEANSPFINKMKHLLAEAGLDIVTVRIENDKEDEGVSQLAHWAREAKHSVLALVDGLFWKPSDPVSFNEFLLGIAGYGPGVQDLIRSKKRRAMTLIRKAVENGADGLIIGDDLAYDQGTFVSPEDLRRMVFPGLQDLVAAIKMKGRLALLHSCGNLTGIIDQILSAGFDVLHGLAPSSGNDLSAIRGVTWNKLALMGAVEVDRLGPREVLAVKKDLFRLMAEGGGYILGSASGLSANTPLDSFRALYGLKAL